MEQNRTQGLGFWNNYHSNLNFSNKANDLIISQLVKILKLNNPQIQFTTETKIDQEEMTDCIMNQQRLSLRVRSFDAFKKYKEEITFRETEIKKILNGIGDKVIMIYAFVNEKANGLKRIVIIKLKELKQLLEKITTNSIKNKDNRYSFCPIQIIQLPSNSFKIYDYN